MKNIAFLFEGALKMGQPWDTSGTATLTNVKTGYLYEGQFVSGLPEGKGALRHADGQLRL